MAILLFHSAGFSQGSIIHGKITILIPDMTYNEVSITLMGLSHDTAQLIKGTIADKEGIFRFDSIPVGKYKLFLGHFPNHADLEQDITITKDTSFYFELSYPGPCPYFKENDRPKCINGHTNGIIPIFYGLPSSKMIKKAKDGKVYLGGCIITNCSPHFYCIIHKKRL